MSLEKEYKRILDEAFGNHFSGWGTLSPLDPIKVLAEAMTGSLTEIERRQRQYVSALMDTLPSLCGFAPKAAELPTTLLSFTPSARLTEARSLPAGTSFRFQREETACEALALESFRISPIFDFVSKREGATFVIDFRYQGIASDLTLQFQPHVKDAGAYLAQVSLEVEGEARETRFEETTSGFRRFGNLTIRAERKEALLFAHATQKARLKLVFDRHLPQGEFGANLAAFRLAQFAEPLALGALTGEPWEEIPLPESVVEAPSECYLSFADEKTLSLVRQETSLLELKHANYETFKGSFFYNGANHSLVIPAADELVGNYNGNVQLLARKAMLRPSFEALSPEMQGRVGDLSAVLEKVTAHQSLSTFLPREAKRNYLARFYGAMGALQMQASSALNTHDLQQQLLSSEKDLRAVETQFEAGQGKLIVYLLAVNPEDAQALQLSSGLLARVSTRLSQLLPLTLRWEIQPFKKVPVTLSLQATAEVGLGMADTGQAKDTLAERVKLWVRPAPFGRLRASTSYSLKDLAKDFGVESIAGKIVKGGVLSEAIFREPGEIFEAETQVQVSLERREVSYVA